MLISFDLMFLSEYQSLCDAFIFNNIPEWTSQLVVVSKVNVP